MITDILDGKTVVALVREIPEIKNAIKTYDVFNELSPYKIDDVFKSHNMMMMRNVLVDDAGHSDKAVWHSINGDLF